MRRSLAVLCVVLVVIFLFFFKKEADHGVNLSTFRVQCPSSAVKDTPSVKGDTVFIKFGKPKYNAPSQTHLAYANPKAPKGGMLRLGTSGSFDNVNGVTLKGRMAEGLSLTKDSLLFSSEDEPGTKYGFIAHSFNIDPDAPSMTMYLRKDVTFHDGSFLTAHDIKATIETLIEDGLPAYRNHYKKIKEIKIPDDHTITFILQGEALPYNALANLAPFSKKHKSFNNHETLIRTGPYFIEAFESGKRITYKKNPCYWAKDLPFTKGLYNFDRIQIDYFKDDVALLESFKKGLFDVWFCSSPKTFYDFKEPSSVFKKLIFKHDKPVPIQSIVFNLERSTLKDRKVRKALTIMFDFNRINAMYFDGLLMPVKSLFANTPMAHQGPATESEKKLLEKFIKTPEPEMLEGSYDFYKGNVYEHAGQLLDEAGFRFKKGNWIRTNDKGEKLVFKLIIRKRRLEKVFNLFKQDLEKIGVQLDILCLEESIFRQMEDKRKYDMMMYTWKGSAQPSVEILSYYGKATGAQKGSANVMCLVDDVAEGLGHTIINAKNDRDLETSVHAFDRYIMHQYYQIPFDYTDKLYLVYRQDRIDFTKDKMAGIDVMTLGWSVS